MKTGAGTLRLAERSDAPETLRVTAGALALATNACPIQAAVWIDAADAMVGEDGRVVSVPNKGTAGGAFAKTAVAGDSTRTPLWVSDADGIHAQPALRFDPAGLILTSYTNKTSPRAVSVYGVFQRDDAWAQTSYATAWSLVSIDTLMSTSAHDTFSNGILLIEGTGANEPNEFAFQFGLEKASRGKNEGFDGSSAYIQRVRVANERAELDFIQAAAGGGTQTNRMECVNGGYFSDPFNVETVALGGRIQAGKFRNGNKGWRGRVGEFLVFDRLLSAAEEADLLAYLSAKWLGTGTVSAPRSLTGSLPTATRTGTALTFADGTAFRTDLAALPVASLAAEGNVTFASDRQQTEETDTAPLFFTVSGAASLAAASVRLELAELPVDAGTLLTCDGVPPLPAAWSLFMGGQDLTGACALKAENGRLTLKKRRGLTVILR